jgi:hypothetical protein
MSKRPSNDGYYVRALKSRSSSSLSSLFALSSDAAFQRLMQELPLDAKMLIRDFVFREGVVTWCDPRAGMHTFHQTGEFRFTYGYTEDRVYSWATRSWNLPCHDFYWYCRATPLEEATRVWVCERVLRTRSSGTVPFVLNLRKNPDLVEDAKEKVREHVKFKYYAGSKYVIDGHR